MNNRIRKLREQAELTQIELSRRTRIAQPLISQLERGAARLWPGYRDRIADALGVNPIDLL